MTDVPTLPLGASGLAMPQVGLGVYDLPDGATPDAVRSALSLGYRHVDTAAMYGNEAEVAEGLRASDVPREQVLVTTKVWSTEMGRDRTAASFERSLAALGSVDLFLVHWPDPDPAVTRETWRLLEELHGAGRVRAIGVSNFGEAELTDLLSVAEVRPVCNQVKLNPLHPNESVRRLDEELGIVTVAWQPLGKGELVSHPAVVATAARLQRTSAQLVLRWAIERGCVVIPKSVHAQRQRENLALFDFVLDDEARTVLDDLPQL